MPSPPIAEARLEARLDDYVRRDSDRLRALRGLVVAFAAVFGLAAVVSLTGTEWGFAALYALLGGGLLTVTRRYLSDHRRLRRSAPSG